jgi:hypothetical protein
MTSSLGWIDFSSEHRDRVRTVLDLLAEKGVVDELGIGVIRDAFADLLFPGISTIQTRAKYFLIVPRLLKDYEALPDRQRRRQSLVNFLAEREKQCRIRLVEKYGKQENLGIIGVSFGTRTDRDVQRQPASVYWNGLRTFGIIKTDLSLAEYGQRYGGDQPSLRLLLEESQEERGDDVDAEDVARSPVITLPAAPDWPDKLAITLRRDEAAFLRQQIVATQPQSLLGQILLDARAQAQFLALSQRAGFVDLAALPFIQQLPIPELRQIVLRARLFWELLRGAHIRYNCLLQDRFGTATLAREYASQWAEWRRDVQAFPWPQWDTAAMWADVAKAGGRVNRAPRLFVERWIELAADLPTQNAPFDQCVREQERANKGSRARLRPDNQGEQVSDWIGIDALAYRLPQAWRIVSDIHEAESRKAVARVGV